jgi:ribosome assembly protein 1
LAEQSDGRRNADKINKIISTLNLKIPPRDLNSKDRNHLLSLMFTQWLPLSTATIQTIIDIIPSPRAAQPTRIPMMLHPDSIESHVEPKSKLEKDLYSCDASESAHVVAYVSKMFAVPTAQLPEHKKPTLSVDEVRARAREARLRNEGSQAQSRAGSPSPAPDQNTVHTVTGEIPLDLKDSSETLLAFARLYSGVIHVRSTVACVLPKYDNAFEPTHPRNKPHVVNTTVDGLYTMMGRDLVAVDHVSAGNIFAIRGLEGSVWRTATICAPYAAGMQGEHAQDWMVNLGAVNRQVCRYSLFSPAAYKVPGSANCQSGSRTGDTCRYAQAHPRDETS